MFPITHTCYTLVSGCSFAAPAYCQISIVRASGFRRCDTGYVRSTASGSRASPGPAAGGVIKSSHGITLIETDTFPELLVETLHFRFCFDVHLWTFWVIIVPSFVKVGSRCAGINWVRMVTLTMETSIRLRIELLHLIWYFVESIHSTFKIEFTTHNFKLYTHHIMSGHH